MNTTAERIVRMDCERIASAVEKELGSIDGASILITGGSGFLGSWLCEMVACLNETHRRNIRLHVVARDKEKFHDRLGHLASKPYVDFIRCDVRSLVEIPKGVNYVIHAAANPDYRFHSSNPIETMTTIAEGTSAALRAADRVSDLRLFLNISASSVYGSQPEDVERLQESYGGVALNAANKSPYAEAKRYAEALCAAARSEARLPVATLRPFTFMGAYQDIDAPWALNNFMNDALRKRPIRIMSDGRTVRSFMYGADLAAWVLAIMLKAKSGQVYNVGCSTGITLFELAQKVASYASPKPEVVLNASLTGIVPSSKLVPDTSAAERDFCLKIYTGIDVAIERTLAWYVSMLENA
jgi:nucleoside-diphosphate-sugar epimerase